jgi:hypothetical protein
VGGRAHPQVSEAQEENLPCSRPQAPGLRWIQHCDAVTFGFVLQHTKHHIQRQQTTLSKAAHRLPSAHTPTASLTSSPPSHCLLALIRQCAVPANQGQTCVQGCETIQDGQSSTAYPA